MDSNPDGATTSYFCQWCERAYPCTNRIADFVVPEQLSEQDAREERNVEKYASHYDLMIKLFNLPFFAWEPTERRKCLQMLRLRPDMRVLEVGIGTGLNISYILKKMQMRGEYVGFDLSMKMLKIAQKRAQKISFPVALHRANGCHLPYKTEYFDVVIHFGSLNTFGEKGNAIEEMLRVTKPEGQILISAEGLKPGMENNIIGRVALKRRPLYSSTPPIKYLPSQIQPTLKWIFRNTFYCVYIIKPKEDGLQI